MNAEDCKLGDILYLDTEPLFLVEVVEEGPALHVVVLQTIDRLSNNSPVGRVFIPFIARFERITKQEIDIEFTL